MTAFTPILPGCDGQWVEDWLSAERFATYLAAANGLRPKALALYEWNIRAASAIQQDLCHLEIGLRNAYDNALRTHWPGPADWTEDPLGVFPPQPSTRGGKGTTRPKARVDVNGKSRALLIKARQDAGGPTAQPGKVVAELSLGFWRYLSIKRLEKHLWVPHLHRAFPAGTDRAQDVDNRIHRLHTVRNRVAHHEPLLGVNLPARLGDILDLAKLINPDLSAYIDGTTQIRQVVADRP
ncbi:hypothetical protein AB0K45_11025 [Micrococcus luteus]|uniref:hypothetical protein n=1 Tax=Micrococcus luteus TaxID=1270 RepID=UPI003428CFFE